MELQCIRGRGIRFSSIGAGNYDAYIHQFAASARAFGEPILISFAPQPDNAAMPWSARTGNKPADFIAAWQHLVLTLQTEGAANIGWVWSPASPKTAATYFPEQAGFIDWIALPIAQDPASPRKSFAEQYDAFHPRIAQWHRPIMITGLNAANNELGANWERDALSDISVRYPEIKSVVLDDNNAIAPPTDDSSWLSETKRTLNLQPFSAGHAQCNRCRCGLICIPSIISRAASAVRRGISRC